ncbi:MAG TPA: PAS domain S-box protein [Spirochaetota bacterium]|nr:PAS domain S-box protein [Spirochaetota bacterium]
MNWLRSHIVLVVAIGVALAYLSGAVLSYEFFIKYLLAASGLSWRGDFLILVHLAISCVFIGLGAFLDRQYIRNRAVAQAARLHSLAVRYSSDGIAVIGRDGVLRYASPGIERIFGYTAADFGNLAEIIDRVVPDPEVRQTVVANWLYDRDADNSPDRIYPIVTGSGDARWCRIRCTRMNADELVVNALDVTDLVRAEEAIKASEEKYRDLFTNAQVGLYRTRIDDGCVIECNDRFARLLGYERRESCIGTCVVLDHYVNPDRRDDMLRELRSSGTVRDFESEYRAKDGALRWLSVTARLFGDAGYIEGAAIDITERRRVERAFQLSEERYRLVVENANEGIIVVQDGFIRFSNPKACEITGYTEREISAIPVMDLIHPDDRTPVGDRYLKYTRRNKPAHQYEFRIIEKGGAIKWLFVNVVAVDWEQGRAALLFFSDINRRKKAENAVREERDRAQRYLDIAGVIIVAIDGSRRVTLINKRGCDILGYAEDEIVGREWFADFIHPEDAGWLAEQYEAMMTQGRLYSDWYQVARIVTREGQDRIIAWHNTVLTDDFGVPSGILSSGEDISEQRRAEAERAKMQAQLLHSQKLEAIGTLAGGIAHDFNNLLTAIKGSVDLALFEVDEGHPIHPNLKQIQHAAVRAADLTRQMLVFSRRQMMESAPLNINRTIENLLKMLKRLIGEDVAITTHLAHDLRDVYLDEGAIEQVVVNLSVNARDAMPNGGQLIIATHNRFFDADESSDMPEARPGEFVCLTITDTGIGMAPEVVGRIFEPFFSTKEVGKGTGLGLSVVYGIIKQHKGWIHVESDPGKGTAFSIFIPAVSSAVAAEPAGEVPPTPQGRDEGVLVVEDQNEVRHMAVKMLRLGGYRVFEAETASEALAVFERERDRIGAIFCDVVLPDMSGPLLVERLCEMSPNCRVLFSSGYSDERSQWDIIRGRGYNFIQKPYSLDELLKAVRKTIDGERDTAPAR